MAFNSGYANLCDADAYGNDIHAVADIVKVRHCIKASQHAQLSARYTSESCPSRCCCQR